MAFWKKQQQLPPQPSAPQSHPRSQTVGDISDTNGQRGFGHGPPQFIPNAAELRMKASSPRNVNYNESNGQSGNNMSNNMQDDEIVTTSNNQRSKNQLAQMEAERKAKLEQAKQGQQVDFRSLLKKKSNKNSSNSNKELPRPDAMSHNVKIPPPAPMPWQQMAQAKKQESSDLTVPKTQSRPHSKSDYSGLSVLSSKTLENENNNGNDDFVPPPYIPPSENGDDDLKLEMDHETPNDEHVIAPNQFTQASQGAQAQAQSQSQTQAVAAVTLSPTISIKSDPGFRYASKSVSTYNNNKNNKNNVSIERGTTLVVAAYNQMMVDRATMMTEINQQLLRLDKKMEQYQESSNWNIKTKLSSSQNAGVISQASSDLLTIMEEHLQFLQQFEEKIENMMNDNNNNNRNNNTSLQSRRMMNRNSNNNSMGYSNNSNNNNSGVAKLPYQSQSATVASSVKFEQVNARSQYEYGNNNNNKNNNMADEVNMQQGEVHDEIVDDDIAPAAYGMNNNINNNMNNSMNNSMNNNNRDSMLRQQMEEEARKAEEMARLQRAMTMPVSDDASSGCYNGCVYYAINNYQGRNDTEWSLKSNEKLICTIHNGDWHYGYKDGNPLDLKYFYKTQVKRFPLMQYSDQPGQESQPGASYV